MKPAPLEEGQLVTHKASNGLPMVVGKINPAGSSKLSWLDRTFGIEPYTWSSTVRCGWFDQHGNYQSAHFAAAELEPLVGVVRAELP